MKERAKADFSASHFKMDRAALIKNEKIIPVILLKKDVTVCDRLLFLISKMSPRDIIYNSMQFAFSEPFINIFLSIRHLIMFFCLIWQNIYLSVLFFFVFFCFWKACSTGGQERHICQLWQYKLISSSLTKKLIWLEGEWNCCVLYVVFFSSHTTNKVWTLHSSVILQWKALFLIFFF